TVQSAQAQMASFRAALVPINTALVTMRTQVLGVAGAWSIAGVRFVAAQTSLVALRGAMVLVTGTARAMWVAIGGIPGLILTGVTFALGSWLTSIDDTTTALDEHE